jgi:hypothetical protein
VLIMRDVACAGYVAGCNTQFFALNRGENNQKQYSLETARQAIRRTASRSPTTSAPSALRRFLTDLNESFPTRCDRSV